MNVRRRAFLAIALLLLSLGMLITSAGCVKHISIVGKWREVSDVNPLELEIFKDGVFVLNFYSGKYAILEGGRIRLESGGMGIMYQFSISEDTLTMVAESGSDKGRVYTFRRIK